ncbi:MFS transporter [Streptomyces sp. NPDC088752]|uniref:MFS transporter n=1 Tax=Streptomyces sp. NPDC088752 TaxID=3154963 RepID=UPI003431E161
MALPTVAGLIAAHSLAAALLELPTGSVADVLGRRITLTSALALNGFALVLQALGTSASTLAFAMVLTGGARALASGPAEAWYVEAERRASGQEVDLRRGLAQGSAVASASMAVGILVGGGLPWFVERGVGNSLEIMSGGSLLPLSVPLLAGAAINVFCAMYILVALHEPRHRPAAPAILGGVAHKVLDSLRLGGRDVVLRRVVLSATASGAALMTLELLTPQRTADLTGLPESGALVFATLACAGLLAHAAGGVLAPHVARFVGGSERAVLTGQAGSTVGMVLVASTALSSGALPTGLAALGFGLMYLGQGVGDPNAADLLHHSVPAANRATAVSMESLGLQMSGALTALVVSRLPGGYWPWWAATTAMLAGALVWVRRAPSDAVVPR